MLDLFDNPMGLDGFEFIEFATTNPPVLNGNMKSLGFVPVANHRSKYITLYRQGGINFVVNNEPRSYAGFYAQEHGPSVTGIAFRVKDARETYERALDLGAQPIEIPTGPMELRLPAIKGIGGILIYFVDRYEEGSSIYDIDFKFFRAANRNPNQCVLSEIDHLTLNVYRGRMDYWIGFFEKFFNFRTTQKFDIQGDESSLKSCLLMAPDGKIRISLCEEASKGVGQIDQFLMSYNGEGMQHIALSTPNIIESYDRMKELGSTFIAPPPNTYYRALNEALLEPDTSLSEIKRRGILLDGNADSGTKFLLQAYTEALLGPVFIEIIQRNGQEGFSEKTFSAVYEALERQNLTEKTLKGIDNAAMSGNPH